MGPPALARAAIAYGTAGVLAGIGVLHGVWGRGRSFPFADRATLADVVVGSTEVPSPGACFAVAGLLGTASALVATAPRGARISRLGAGGVAAVLLGRGALGFAGRTDMASPGSVSPRFRRLDRRFFSPLCIALGLGAIVAARAPRSTGTHDDDRGQR